MSDEITYAWRGPVTDAEVVDLVESHGGRPAVGWWDQIRPYSLGWVIARAVAGTLVGFVNVAWDGGDHAFLVDTKTRGSYQHRGIGTAVVRRAAHHAQAVGCEWLHVDFERSLASFYVEACGTLSRRQPRAWPPHGRHGSPFPSASGQRPTLGCSGLADAEDRAACPAPAGAR